MDLCKMFEFDCKVTQNISINSFLSLKINNFYILQQYSTKIPAYLLPHCKITMGRCRKICFLTMWKFLLRPGWGNFDVFC